MTHICMCHTYAYHTYRSAHTDRYTKQQGNLHNSGTHFCTDVPHKCNVCQHTCSIYLAQKCRSLAFLSVQSASAIGLSRRGERQWCTRVCAHRSAASAITCRWITGEVY